MNFDDILGKLLPLFEQKMAFTMEMSKRAMSLEEKKEASKTDLEYRKLEAQITNDKDKLKWEKEKLTSAVKADSDLQVLKNSGMLDLERLKQIGEKDKQKIMEEGANSRAKLNADTETNKAYLATLGTILGHAQEVSQTGLDGQTKTSKPTEEVKTASRSLMEQTGLARPAARPQGRNVAGEAEVAAGVLREHEKAGTADAARNYLNALDSTVRAETLKLLNPGNAVAPAPAHPDITPAIPPVAPAPGVRTPIPTVQPAAMTAPTVTAARPSLSPAESVSIGTDRHLRDNPLGGQPVPGAPVTPAPPLSVEGKTAFGRTPGGVLGDIWNRGAILAEQKRKQREDEEDKSRALRRARGLTVGGF